VGGLGGDVMYDFCWSWRVEYGEFFGARATSSMFGGFLRLWSLLSVLESLVFVSWVTARCAATVISYYGAFPIKIFDTILKTHQP
jgi:hypothetical protein